MRVGPLVCLERVPQVVEGRIKLGAIEDAEAAVQPELKAPSSFETCEASVFDNSIAACALRGANKTKKVAVATAVTQSPLKNIKTPV